jgi:dTDP-4-dehydrorhamnose reductase
MKILLFGKNGQVGGALQRSLAPLGTLVALGSENVNFTDLAGLADSIRATAPDVIVNAAAYTAVDRAESEPDLAYAINAYAVEVVAREAARCGAWLVHYSTDYVFDGSGNVPWREEDAPAPLNVYGATKLAGERFIQASGCRHLIFRTSWVYAARGTNFIQTMLRLGQEREALKVVNDQIGAPTGAMLIAEVTAQAIRMAVQKPESGGLYHLTAAGETSWYDYARFIFDMARKTGEPIKVATDAVTPLRSQDFPTPAKRPLNSRLNTGKLQRAMGISLPPWQQGVAQVLSANQT